VQQRPDKAALLDAVAQFLISEVYPALPDKKLNFRVLIAANLANVVSAELKSEEARASSELARLEALLPEGLTGELEKPPGALTGEARAQALTVLNRALSEGIRKRRFSPETLKQIQAHLKQTLTDTLSVVNPRFDTSPIIE